MSNRRPTNLSDFIRAFALYLALTVVFDKLSGDPIRWVEAVLFAAFWSIGFNLLQMLRDRDDA